MAPKRRFLVSTSLFLGITYLPFLLRFLAPVFQTNAFFFSSFQEYITSYFQIRNIIWWLSVPVCISLIAGVVMMISKRLIFPGTELSLLGWYSVTILLIFVISPQPVTLLLLSPLIVVGVSNIWAKFPQWVSVLMLFMMAPFFWQMLNATSHSAFREMESIVLDLRKGHSNAQIFASCYPSQYSAYLGIPVQHLPDRLTKTTIIIDSDLCLGERRGVDTVLTPEELIQKKVWHFTDSGSHFPYTSRGNIYSIFLVIPIRPE